MHILGHVEEHLGRVLSHLLGGIGPAGREALGLEQVTSPIDQKSMDDLKFSVCLPLDLSEALLRRRKAIICERWKTVLYGSWRASKARRALAPGTFDTIAFSGLMCRD